MTAPENTRERLAEALRKCQMVPYDDGKGGWLFRAARPEEQADALLPLIDTLLREQREGIAAAALRQAADALRAEHDPCEPDCTVCGDAAEGDSVAAWLDLRAASGEALEGCDCTELCSMGPTCPGGMLADLPDSGCWRSDAAPIARTFGGER